VNQNDFLAGPIPIIRPLWQLSWRNCARI